MLKPYTRPCRIWNLSVEEWKWGSYSLAVSNFKFFPTVTACLHYYRTIKDGRNSHFNPVPFSRNITFEPCDKQKRNLCWSVRVWCWLLVAPPCSLLWTWLERLIGKEEEARWPEQVWGCTRRRRGRRWGSKAEVARCLCRHKGFVKGQRERAAGWSWSCQSFTYM